MYKLINGVPFYTAEEVDELIRNTDVDQERQRAEAAEQQLQENISAETVARVQADSLLQTNVNAEADVRSSADNQLQEHIDAETRDREASEQVLQNNISAEADRAAEAEGLLSERLVQEAEKRQTEDFALSDRIGSLIDLNTDDKTSIVLAINWVLERFNTLIGEITSLETTDKTNVVSAINWVLNNFSTIIGELTNIDTTDKTNIVSAINELKNTIDSEIDRAKTVEGDIDYLDTEIVLEHKDLVNAINFVYKYKSEQEQTLIDTVAEHTDSIIDIDTRLREIESGGTEVGAIPISKIDALWS